MTRPARIGRGHLTQNQPATTDGVVGMVASTELNAILTPDEPTTLAAHMVPEVQDPNCDAVYDLTRWA